MGKEIERKFLTDDSVNEVLKDGKNIVQGYILNTPEKVVRIRYTDSKGFLTVKMSTDSAVTRNEFEYEIPVEDAKEMLYGVKVLKKTRYEYEFRGNLFEIDVFENGLILVEIELESEEQEFEKPSFLKAEVTFDKRYLNSEMIKRA